VRKLLLVTLVLCISSPAWATISRLQSKANFTGSGSTCAATFTTNPSAHDLVVVWTSWKTSTATASARDTQKNTYSNAVGPTTQSTSGVNSQVFYAKDVAGGSSDTVTVTYSASTPTCAVVIVEYSGPDQNFPLDLTYAYTGTGTPLGRNVAAPTFVNELVFGAGSVDTGRASAEAGFSSIQTKGGSITEDNILIPNARQHATGASSSGNWVMQIATFRNTAPTFGGSVGVAGTRPYVDVTAYGAKGIGMDDTAAIRAAITAACGATIGRFGVVQQVYFPPGYYGIQQPQTPSTAAPLIVPCSIEFIGGGGTTPQFETQPVPSIGYIPGASPNAAPIFSVTGSGVTFNHLLVDGYNQAVQLKQTSNIRFQDCFLRAEVTGDPDNAPLVEINSLWTFFNGGGLGFGNPSPRTFKNLYDVEWLGEKNASGDITYLQYFTNATMFGGGFLYDQRAASINGIPSNFVLLNISIEDSANPVFTGISSTGNPIGITAVEVDHALIEDSLASTPQAIFYWNQNAVASGITINASSAGGNGPAIVQAQGTVASYVIYGCANNCAQQAVDGSGNPAGGGPSQTASGFDFVSDLSDNFRLITNFSQPTMKQGDGASIRMFASGSGGGYSTVGLDSTGVLFGNGISNGWTGQFVQSNQNTLDIGFSTTLPPTGVTATPVSGGTLANGTYYYFVSPEVGAGGCGTPYTGAPSLVSAAATTTSGNNQVNVSWTLPPTAPATLAGFCVFRNNVQSTLGTQTGAYVSGATATRVTDTGSSFSTVGSGVEINHMQSFHRFTTTSLGIGTLNPLFNADIRGSIGGATYNTQTNCSSNMSPAACVSASAGSVTVAASATTEVVNTTAITANSQVLLTFDSSLGTRLGVTCNATAVQGAISARTPGTSFTIKVPTAPSTDPACFSYEIVN
jgi:hypothetical protein